MPENRSLTTVGNQLLDEGYSHRGEFWQPSNGSPYMYSWGVQDLSWFIGMQEEQIFKNYPLTTIPKLY